MDIRDFCSRLTLYRPRHRPIGLLQRSVRILSATGVSTRGALKMMDVKMTDVKFYGPMCRA